MIAAVWQFLVQHHTAIAVSGLWIYSVVASNQPPLSEDAGYYKKWAHGVFQATAANVKTKPPV